MPYAKMDDPQSLNLYAYVGNNPLRGVDHDGHDFLTTDPTEMDNSEAETESSQSVADQQQAQLQARLSSIKTKLVQYLKQHIYFKNEGGIGLGDKAKIGTATLDVSLKDTFQNTSTASGSTKAEVRHIGLSLVVGDKKFGFAAEQSTLLNQNGKDVFQPGPWTFVPGFEQGKTSVEGSQIGVGDTLCVLVCGGYEVGIQK